MNEQGIATRIVLKFGGREGASQWSSELVTNVDEVTALGETEVRIDVAETTAPIRWERTVGGTTTRPAESFDIRAITLGRQGDIAIVKLDTPTGPDFMITCDANEAVEIGGVARKLIALNQQ